MAYVRKTEDVYDLEYNYGYGDGVEVIDHCATLAEARAARRDYIANEHICPTIRKRRYPITRKADA